MHLLNEFSFKNASISDIKKELQNLDTRKATQKSDLLTKTIKENSSILAPFLLGSVNSFIDLSNVLKNLKFADITPAYKKNSRNDKTNYRPISIPQIYLKSLKTSFISKYQNFLTISSRNIKQVFKIDLAHKLA